jgi:signal transduction histidine kinase
MDETTYLEINKSLLEFVIRLPGLPVCQISALPQEAWYSLTQMTDIGQHLVELVKQQMRCDQVLLYTHTFPEGYTFLLSACGLSEEQLHKRCAASGAYRLSDYFDQDVIERLQNQEVIILPRSQVHLPPAYADDFGEQVILIVPLCARQHLVGRLVVGRTDKEKPFSERDIELVKAIATLIVLVLERLLAMRKWMETVASEQALAETNQRMNDFINLASHELNTPLTAEIGSIQLAQHRLQRLRKIQPDHPEVQRQLERVESALHSAMESAHQQKHLINYMVDDSLLQSNSLTLNKYPYNLADIVRDVVETMRPNHPQHPIRVFFSDQEADYPVCVDRDRVKEVLHCFLGNALAYSSRESAVDVTMSKRGSEVQVQVQDRGPGLSSRDQEHIWERFYRSQGFSVQHRLDLSMGLALYICKRLIELHGGEVGLESTPGIGSTFWFSLPLST